MWETAIWKRAAVQVLQRLQRLLLRLKWEVWNHHPYSPDVAISDYFIFPALKRNLSGTQFISDNAMKTAAEKWLNEQGPGYYQDGINKLVEHSDKCLNRVGDYVKN